MNISVDRIVVNPENRINQGSPKTLVSVLQEGIIVPLLVVKNGERYDLIDGHNRLHSAKKFGLKEVPVIEITREQAETFGEVCNLDRQGLNELDEIISIKKLAEKGYRVDTISTMLNMPRSKVGRRVKVLEGLSENARKLLDKRKLSLDQAEALVLVDKSVQDEIIKKNPQNAIYAVNEHLGVYLHAFGKCFKEGCDTCKYNTASNADLFSETESRCSNPECLTEKIEKYVKENKFDGCTGYLSNYAGITKPASYVASDYASRSIGKPHPSYTNQKKLIDFNGDIVYSGGERIETVSLKAKKETAIKEAIQEVNLALLDIYSQIRKHCFSLYDIDLPLGFGESGFMKRLINLAYRDLADRHITRVESYYFCRELNAEESHYTNYGELFKLLNPTVNPNKAVGTKPFNEAVGKLINDYSCNQEISDIALKVKDFGLSSMYLYDGPWAWNTSLDGSLMDRVRLFVKAYEKFAKAKVVEESSITAASLAYMEACRLFKLDEKEFKEAL